MITEVDSDSDAADKGLKPGDIILQVAGVDVSTPGDVAKGLARRLPSPPRATRTKVKILMQVKTGDQTRFVALSQKKG